MNNDFETGFLVGLLYMAVLCLMAWILFDCNGRLVEIPQKPFVGPPAPPLSKASPDLAP